MCIQNIEMHIYIGKHLNKFLQRTYQIITVKIFKECLQGLFLEKVYRNFGQVHPSGDGSGEYPGPKYGFS